jgi:predicted nucleic acid-binding protein
MTDKIFIDSNIWVYLFAQEDDLKWKTTEHFIRENSRLHSLVISYQVINEVTHVLKKKKFTEQQIRFVIDNLVEICTVQGYSKEIALWASFLREKNGFSFWDSHIVASALTANCQYLISEDMQDNQIVDGMILKNIFK